MQTLSERIVRYLPNLRCYAHGLSGSQQRGDVRLKLFLEVLLQHRDEMSSSADIRKDLYRLFHTVLHRLDLDLEGGVETGADQRLRYAVASLPPRAREVLLLTSMANFTMAEVSDILGIRRAGVEHQLAEAQGLIKQRMSARILIIEDEDHKGAQIERALEKMGHTVVGIAHSDEKAVELARDTRPELVLADVHGLAGAETARHIQSSTDTPVVFLGPPHSRRLHARAPGSRKVAGPKQAARRVSTQDIRSAVDQVLPRPQLVAANALR
ncbi:MAG TPA: sigma factor-like helix-turn-helix DNA-binding protein [Alphaproteobacteria bacterium]